MACDVYDRRCNAKTGRSRHFRALDGLVRRRQMAVLSNKPPLHAKMCRRYLAVASR